MIDNDAELAPDPTWWTAPFATTLFGLPLLVWECVIFGFDSYVSSLDAMVYGGLVLLVIAWTLPRHRSARMLRVTAAVAGLACAVLPLASLVLMGMAMASG
ncbi:hypothetical protein ABIE67_004805 [Streptomyces sp. V4I8]|uniref:hypothetical protein n=1 Tax=Streptomyces sp. V4I8 TaxID=3156469 RepID=UPI0035163C01